uniref:Uncharacterized protein n=1 Tax=Bracon brevicornis TaxID=1563983 RepID=A0A6V7JJ23_9HYME
MRELRTRVNKVTGQFSPRAEDLARENNEMALSLPDDDDLLGFDSAVHEAAIRLKPRTVAESTVEARTRRRIKQPGEDRVGQETGVADPECGGFRHQW